MSLVCCGAHTPGKKLEWFPEALPLRGFAGNEVYSRWAFSKSPSKLRSFFFCCDFVKIASPLDSLCRYKRWSWPPFLTTWLTSVTCAPDPYQQDGKGDAHHLLRYPQTSPSLREVTYIPVAPFPSCNSEYPLPVFSCHLSQRALKNSWISLLLSTIPAELPLKCREPCLNEDYCSWPRFPMLGKKIPLPLTEYGDCVE